MFHHLQHIVDMAEILFAHGVRDVVISPGSRNAPLIKAFYDRFGDGCRSLVDERSAAFFALGQSLATHKPGVLICTSGSAVLNYAPAIAEAYYQQVPLLIITADRPPEWIGQLNNQAVQQNNIFENYIKAGYTLPLETIHSDDLWYAHRMVNEAYQKTVDGNFGPVHINVPLKEPLYESLPPLSKRIRIINKEETLNSLQSKSKFLADWENANSILFICGQTTPENKVLETLHFLSTDSRIVIVAEPVSNFHQIATVSNPEITFNNKINYPGKAIPEMVIYLGGQVISKKIKLFLRGLKKTVFYRISTDEQIIDTFQNINTIINAEPFSVLTAMQVQKPEEISDFKGFWQNESRKAERLSEKYTEEIEYSDLLVFKKISELLPDDALVFAGNSSVVRYLIYFNQKNRKYYSNRGVSGIDGCLSAAAGLASKVDEPVFVIVGDLAFAYDSNALWNRELPKNLKIILVNNEGGGIFHLLKGPSETDDFNPFVNAYHPIDFKKITEAFGLGYQLCNSENELSVSVSNLIRQNETAGVLEIQTPGNGKPQITKDFFKFLNNNYEPQLGDD